MALYSNSSPSMRAMSPIGDVHYTGAKESIKVLASKAGSGFTTRVLYGTMLAAAALVIIYMGHTAVATTLFFVQVGVFTELINVRYEEGKEPYITCYII